jgi:hypothetical protein
MAVATSNVYPTEKGSGEVIQSMPIADNVHIYKGQAIHQTGGYARIAVVGDTTPIFGHAMEEVDNTLVGHAAGLKRIRVTAGRRVLLTGTGFSQASVGTMATVVDANTIGTGGTCNVGIIEEFVSSTKVWVFVPVKLA